MLCSGIQPFTLLDYPGKIACVVFLAGCPFRCGYCHNPEFVLPEQIKKISDSFITMESLLTFLDARRGKLEGVVISGGEPTTSANLPGFIQAVRDHGFAVKLDTNGYFPERLCALIGAGMLDYIAMDIKADVAAYSTVAGISVDIDRIRHSIAAIMQSGVEYEFRTTLIREIHSPLVITRMANLIQGAKQWSWQQFRPQHVLNNAWSGYHSYTTEEMSALAAGLDSSIPIHIRS